MNQKLLFLTAVLVFNFSVHAQSTIIDQVEDCATGCSDLTLNFDQNGETSDYLIESIPFNPPTAFSGFQNLLPNFDDLWSGVIDMSLNFCFFGDTYNQLQIGTNGSIRLDVDPNDQSSGWAFTEPLPNNINPTLGESNIFGALHDLDTASFGDGGEIGWDIIGVAPFRAFVVSFDEVSNFNCVNSKTTQMMVLYETTNVIEVYLLNKPGDCTAWNNGNAVVGIQNNDGTQAFVPPGRNTGQWSAQNEAWRFTPSANITANTVNWYDQTDTLIGTGTTINVCPTTEETYTAEVNYTDGCTGVAEMASTSITVVPNTGGVVNQPTDYEVCDDNNDGLAVFDLTIKTDEIIGQSICYVLTFHESLIDADTAINAIFQPENYVNLSNPQTIYVRVENSDSSNYEVTQFDIRVITIDNVTSPTPLEVCDDDFDGFSVFDLDSKTNEITGGDPDLVVTYHETQASADAGNSSLSSPYFNIINNIQTIYARVEDLNSSCFTTVELLLLVNQGPQLNGATLAVCDEDGDGIAIFDLTTVLPEIIGGEPNPVEIVFFETQDDAINDVNPIVAIDSYVSLTFSSSVFARGQSTENGCYTIVVVELFVEPVPNLIDTTSFVACDYTGDNDGFAQFNFQTKRFEILNDNGLDGGFVTVNFYETQDDADNDTNVLPTNYNNTTAYFQTVYVRATSDFVGCFDTTTLDLVVEYCPIACDTPVNINYCYQDNDTTEYIFSSENGSPLTVLFNAGQLEIGTDLLIVKDTDGSILYSGNGANDGSNANNLMGLNFASTGSSISVSIQSDANGSCITDNFVPWDFDVLCSDSVGLIQVNAFLDDNTNDVFDDGEVNFNQGAFTYEVNNDGIINYVNSSIGNFIIPNTTESNTYDIGFLVYDEYQACTDQSVTLFENVTVANGSTTTINFPVTETQSCSDIGVYLFSYVPPRPGFEYFNYLVIENLGLEAVSGSVEFTHDPSVTLTNVDFVDAGNSVVNTANGFTLNFNNLQPGIQEWVVVGMDVPTTANLGDLITNSVIYNVVDVYLENNESILTEEVVNSYDPNDKSESHGREILVDDFTQADYLFYTIRFQNLGTADAINIRVEDVLESSLDASSFKMLSASHDYMVERNENLLTWNFNNINLPDANSDEPNSHGYIYFKIKPNSGYAEGDIIPNSADIYFDFNDAIITNTWETEFFAGLSVQEFIENQFLMYPNPTNHIVNIQLKNVNDLFTVAIYDVQGKSVLTTENQSQIDVSALQGGLYFVKVKTVSGETIQKLIIE